MAFKIKYSSNVEDDLGLYARPTISDAEYIRQLEVEVKDLRAWLDFEKGTATENCSKYEYELNKVKDEHFYNQIRELLLWWQNECLVDPDPYNTSVLKELYEAREELIEKLIPKKP